MKSHSQSKRHQANLAVYVENDRTHPDEDLLREYEAFARGLSDAERFAHLCIRLDRLITLLEDHDD